MVPGKPIQGKRTKRFSDLKLTVRLGYLGLDYESTGRLFRVRLGGVRRVVCGVITFFTDNVEIS